jgi:DNA-binding NtrC family response regulator
MGHVDKKLIWETLGINADTGELRAAPAKKDMKQKREFALVVDSDSCVKDVTGEILERYGLGVLTAGSREEALTFCECRGREISLALLDVVALGPETRSVVQRFLEINPAMKIIITSIYNHGLSPADVFGWGAAGFLKKPYRISELLIAVEQVQKTH